ncbi:MULTISPECIES: DUF1330 domain-containing protein [Streptomycetaceae]|uniref:DUF1330 domain-containing protein n=1 Tax=Streptantibioticus cattleyicolor (strain ATCC 35852 / DSM 46488 / JCM 4925 / NBRC 14057 / NRRL 8057) TaxID=1003195 RepID=F8JSH5_STREN|nr:MULTISPECIES: DUF1330 domain-containing protein [Streptomycetaceae]AEW96699.1 hypothetical protein SCATT_43280 [Streptantibioticus cattleyicolor NRRL 8057 = DSM 46488]MYS61188.1 DUF1330 domain-containing protein [Streptomyces sp. SID5468]CCB77037.1 conserved protein of unknown function [Streptantibioticus cattleyicolor NRRL 8057 = DSM 46488]
MSAAYAIAYVRETVNPSPEIAEYMRRIEGTLEGFGGRFLIHDGVREVLEGAWPGGLIVIGFPDMDSARRWYASPEYQEILPLRTRNIVMDVILAEGVPEGYRAEEAIAKLPFPV